MLPAIQATFSNPRSGLPVLGRILPPSQLGKFHFLLLGLASSVCGRKDILLILVINPLVISETRAKIIRKAQDATDSFSPSLHNQHQTFIFLNSPLFFLIQNKVDGVQTYFNAYLCLTRDLQHL